MEKIKLFGWLVLIPLIVGAYAPDMASKVILPIGCFGGSVDIAQAKQMLYYLDINVQTYTQNWEQGIIYRSLTDKDVGVVLTNDAVVIKAKKEVDWPKLCRSELKELKNFGILRLSSTYISKLCSMAEPGVILAMVRSDKGYVPKKMSQTCFVLSCNDLQNECKESSVVNMSPTPFVLPEKTGVKYEESEVPQPPKESGPNAIGYLLLVLAGGVAYLWWKNKKQRQTEVQEESSEELDTEPEEEDQEESESDSNSETETS